MADSDDRDSKLYAELYEELRRIASLRMRSERRGHTLQTTALIHEAYLKLNGKASTWRDRSHFLGTAAVAMRNILRDHARRRKRRLRLLEANPEIDDRLPGDVEYLDFDRALDQLAKEHERQARAIELRCVLGLDVKETAQELDVSERTVKADTRFAVAWLRARLADYI